MKEEARGGRLVWPSAGEVATAWTSQIRWLPVLLGGRGGEEGGSGGGEAERKRAAGGRIAGVAGGWRARRPGTTRPAVRGRGQAGWPREVCEQRREEIEETVGGNEQRTQRGSHGYRYVGYIERGRQDRTARRRRAADPLKDESYERGGIADLEGRRKDSLCV